MTGLKLIARSLAALVVVVALISASAADALQEPETTTPGVKPLLSELQVTPDHFRVRARRGPHHKVSGGTRITFQLSGAAEVEILISHRAGCSASPRKACILLISGDAKIEIAGHPGRNMFHFSGLVRGHPLPPGDYLLGVKVAGGSKLHGQFTILGPSVSS